MFLNILKYKILKKSAEAQLLKGQKIDLLGEIKEVGVILNQKDFPNRELIIQELSKHRIKPEQLVFLISNADLKTLKANEIAIKASHFDTRGQLKDEKVEGFIQKKFELLISYYDLDEPLLLWCTAHSKAKFKVGFSSVKINNNHFVLQLETGQHKSYIDELFRYIEILKK
ncbi:hypothetical protein [Flavobacterium sp. NKUCC04_CG]|uniref:DUF6913 domain-containing protein n=1 Tax=Flavobacterium sp. NKUCC04_CG TaxID=2842121 RepID=UPI001C5B628D|nr:hypothetical protein [Flavobacterium sp. NKUCC04_CG]MBW3519309.1 hypothetical protein [Flavobacterium sp. NKUCC04_CG]